jgi:cell division protein FtsB
VLCVASGSADLARQVADLRERNETLEAEVGDLKVDLRNIRDAWDWMAKARPTSTKSKP